MNSGAARTVRRAFAVAGLAALLALVVAGPASAQEGDPEGNNGNVKIHAGAGEPEDIHKNEPQVCTFHIHAFNFDPEQLLQYTITGAGGVVESGSFRVGPSGNGREPADGAMSVENAGSYELLVQTDDGSKSKTFQVTCEGGVLGVTGSESSPFLTVAGLLMTVGAGLILNSRRRVWSLPRS